MKDDSELPSLSKLGKELRVAAERELQPRTHARTRRYGRRLSTALAAIMVLAVAGAGAVEIISVGEPAKENRELPTGLAPDRGARDALSVVAADPELGSGLSWGARAFTSSGGEDCVLVGLRRGRQLGVVRGGRFEPYRRGGPAVCGRYGKDDHFSQVSVFTEPRVRAVVYGRARRGVDRIVIRAGETSRAIRPSNDGSFLAVFDGRIDRSELTVRTR